MTCPACHHESPAGARFCEQCATALVKTCVECKAVLSDNARFCHACAHHVGGDTETPRRDQPANVKPAEPPRSPEPKIGASAGVIAGLSRLAPLIQGVLLAAVGTIATVVYNQRQLQLAQLSALDKYRTYLASENPQERIFGYEAFVALGQEQFVIRLIAAKQDVAAKQVLTSVATSSSDEATREEAQRNLDALLADSQKQAALGRRDIERQNLDKLLKTAPDNEAARLQRDTLDDWRYLVKAQSKISSAPYLRLAQYSAQNGQTREARALLERAASLFSDVRVLDVAIKYNGAEANLGVIRDSLTLAADDGSWEEPPAFLTASSFLDGDRLLIWIQGAPSAGVALRFERYGFDPVTLRARAADLKQPAFVVRELTVRRTRGLIARNVLQGKVRLHETERSDGVMVSAIAQGANVGFSKTDRSGPDGTFRIDGIPDGDFELKFAKNGYVPYDLSVSFKSGALICKVDRLRHYSESGINGCRLDELDLVLHRIRNLTLRWTLQEDPKARHFRGSISSGEARLTSGLPHDWSRGGWGCCQATFKFGSKTVDDNDPDVVVFTETDGQIYFGQPHRPFIVESSQDFDALAEIPSSTRFKDRVAVAKGTTYLLTTRGISDDDDDKSPRFFVKMKVIDVR